jgi:Sigma-70, region 4
MLAAETLAGMARLPNWQREALVAVAIRGRSRAEVARRMDLSEGAVRQLVHRARERLRAAATAITPYPLVRTLAAVRSAPSGPWSPEVAIGAGSASAGGIALKVGTLIASGVVATGFSPPAPISSHVRVAPDTVAP